MVENKCVLGSPLGEGSYSVIYVDPDSNYVARVWKLGQHISMFSDMGFTSNTIDSTAQSRHSISTSICLSFTRNSEDNGNAEVKLQSTILQSLGGIIRRSYVYDALSTAD